jgi:hypothetical protein
VAPGQRFLRKLNERQTAALIKITCTVSCNPSLSNFRLLAADWALSKRGLLSAHTRKIKYGVWFACSLEYLLDWGLKVSSEPATIQARVLPTPQIQYHHTSKLQGLLTPTNGTWNLVGQKVCAGAELGSWSIVCFCPQRVITVQGIEFFVKELCNAAVDSGVLSLMTTITLDDRPESQSTDYVCELSHFWR